MNDAEGFVFDTTRCEINEMRLLAGTHCGDDLEFAVNSDDIFMVSLAEQDKDLIKWADTPDEAFTQLRAHLETHHIEPKTLQEQAAPGIAQ